MARPHAPLTVAQERLEPCVSSYRKRPGKEAGPSQGRVGGLTSIWSSCSAVGECPLFARSGRLVSTWSGHCGSRPWTLQVGTPAEVRSKFRSHYFAPPKSFKGRGDWRQEYWLL